jgi:hypothetical protein
MKIAAIIVAVAVIVGFAYAMGPDLARYMKIRSM